MEGGSRIKGLLTLSLRKGHMKYIALVLPPKFGHLDLDGYKILESESELSDFIKKMENGGQPIIAAYEATELVVEKTFQTTQRVIDETKVSAVAVSKPK